MTTTTLEASHARRAPWGWLALALVLWIAAYWNLTTFADALLSLTGLDRNTHLGEAVHFFLYDTPKVLLLLTTMKSSSTATSPTTALSCCTRT